MDKLVSLCKWHAMVRARGAIEGPDAAILTHPRVREASGHVAGFVEPLVDGKACKGRFRADKLEYFDQQANRRYVPYAVETSVAADRVREVIRTRLAA